MALETDGRRFHGNPLCDAAHTANRRVNATKPPEELSLIGGWDHFLWARICRDDDEPEGIYRGEYVDRISRYTGTFRYVHPQGKNIPERIFKNFHMALIESEGGRFHQNSPNIPIDYFYMTPTHPKNIRWADY